MLIKQGEFSDRNNFGTFLNERGLRGTGVEIGTHQAEFANTLLCQWKGQSLFCIDPYVTYDKVQEERLPNRAETRTDDYLRAESRLLQHGSRATLTIGTSVAVSKTFKDESLDFVYIDGDHRYQYVKDDLNRWYPKIKSGGLLCGHDIVNSEWEGVQQSVLEFCEEENLDLYLVIESTFLPWSYYMWVK